MPAMNITTLSSSGTKSFHEHSSRSLHCVCVLWQDTCSQLLCQPERYKVVVSNMVNWARPQVWVWLWHCKAAEVFSWQQNYMQKCFDLIVEKHFMKTNIYLFIYLFDLLVIKDFLAVTDVWGAVDNRISYSLPGMSWHTVSMLTLSGASLYTSTFNSTS